MAIPTYRILVIPGSNNEYGVDRSETWVIKPGPIFYTKEAAREFVLQANRKYLPSQLHEKVRTTRTTYFDVCFDPKYAKYQRFFLEKPSIELLRAQLAEDGVTVP